MKLSVRKKAILIYTVFTLWSTEKIRDIKDFVLMPFASHKAIQGKLVVLSVFVGAQICAQNEVEVKIL